jgi:phosphatidylserine/phosphatidylglycerophosphate/cardiolipin synthase-like enzyme
MPSRIEKLKKKWFLREGGGGPAAAVLHRHEGSKVSQSTDGNLVTPLIEGKTYMKVWHDRIRTMIKSSNCEVYHAGWRFEGVRTLGHSVKSSDALETLRDANTAKVAIYPLICNNHFTIVYNRKSIEWLQGAGISNACLDQRYPKGGPGVGGASGSNHQKFVCLKNPADAIAILGSIDISKSRWDTGDHKAKDSERDPTFGKHPTHDIGVLVQGPAVADIEWTFIERWNDPTRTSGLVTLGLKTPPPILSPVSTSTGVGPHSIQVLHTYGITNAGYSWSVKGEFTVWSAYLNAIQTAREYIYIEDQYFLAFDDPPCHGRTGTAQQTDIIYQLGEAIKRGVRVVVVVPSNSEDFTHVYQIYQRDIGVDYLETVAAVGGAGTFVIASLHNKKSPIYVHAKLMICDDEFVLLGSANICQRSMTHDSELQIGIVDADEEFALKLRKTLWSEHLQVPASSSNLDSVSLKAYELFKKAAISSSGRLTRYLTGPVALHPRPPGGVTYGSFLRQIDPYGGPPMTGR